MFVGEFLLRRCEACFTMRVDFYYVCAGGYMFTIICVYVYGVGFTTCVDFYSVCAWCDVDVVPYYAYVCSCMWVLLCCVYGCVGLYYACVGGWLFIMCVNMFCGV